MIPVFGAQDAVDADRDRWGQVGATSSLICISDNRARHAAALVNAGAGPSTGNFCWACKEEH